MATFSSFLDILPDPVNPIGDAGQALATGSGGAAGPGFASVKLSSNRNTMLDRTNSGRAVARSIAGHSWKVDINYNPLTRDEFEPVYSFLLSRLGKLNPFYVILPNQSASRNTTFATFAGGNVIYVEAGTTAANAGQTYMLIDGLTSSSGEPRPGDMFNVTDSTNTNHVKMYRLTRVETMATYTTTIADPPVSHSERRIHFTPPLAYTVTNNQSLNFVNPKIRVRLAGDVQEYSLGTNNLYQFSLKLEEALP